MIGKNFTQILYGLGLLLLVTAGVFSTPQEATALTCTYNSADEEYICTISATETPPTGCSRRNTTTYACTTNPTASGGGSGSVASKTCTTAPGSTGTYICTPRLSIKGCTEYGASAMSCTNGVPTGYAITKSGGAVTGTIRVSPTTVERGGTITLSWEAFNTDECTISGTKVNTAGRLTYAYSKNSGDFVLQCKGTIGSMVQLGSASITVTEPAEEEATDDTRETGDAGGASDITVRDNNLTYVPLEPLVGVNQSGQAPFGELIGGFFRILINIGAFLAVVMFVVGGIIYMVSDSTFKKLKGKDTIKAALIGLGILAGAWLILNTINPQLITFDKDFLQPAYSVTVTEKTSNLVKNGVERKDISNTNLKKLEKEFNCPTDGRRCIWDEMLIFDNNKSSTSKVKKAIEQFKSDCRGTFGSLSDWDVKTKAGTLVGAPKNTTVQICKMN